MTGSLERLLCNNVHRLKVHETFRVVHSTPTVSVHRPSHCILCVIECMTFVWDCECDLQIWTRHVKSDIDYR